MKNKSNNKLVCQITGKERISNAKYLAAKAAKSGITVEEFKAFYVSKSGLVALKSHIEQTSLANVANANSRTEEDIDKMIRYNGRGKVAKASKRELKKDEVVLSTENASVALELAQAEIERTKEQLVAKQLQEKKDKRNARRRELRAEKKLQRAKNRAAAGCTIKGDQELIGQ